MNLYLASSAVVKLYVRETGTEVIRNAVDESDTVGTSLVTRAEVSAAFAKAVRTGALDHSDADACLEAFRNQWRDYVRVPVTESLVDAADSLVHTYQLRGYDSIQHAAALKWSDALDSEVTVATWDRQLWEALTHTSLDVLPTKLE